LPVTEQLVKCHGYFSCCSSNFTAPVFRRAERSSRLGEKPSAWAECLFVDPIGDIAVIGPPDEQVFFGKMEAYRSLMEDAVSISISKREMNGPAWLLSLEGGWFQCSVEDVGGSLYILDASEPIRGGMSGSPIIADDGLAIGVVCTSSGDTSGMHGPNPSLTYHLPAGLLREVVGKPAFDV
jgi:hypothetical protein